MRFKTLVAKNPEHGKFARFSSLPGLSGFFFHDSPEIVPLEWTKTILRQFLIELNAPEKQLEMLDQCDLVEVEVTLCG